MHEENEVPREKTVGTDASQHDRAKIEISVF